MKEERKQINAINQAIGRIAETPMGKMSNSDLQLLMLQRLDDRLREVNQNLIKMNSQNKVVEPDRPTVTQEPKKRKGIFAFIK
jgi:hypothetical protein